MRNEDLRQANENPSRQDSAVARRHLEQGNSQEDLTMEAKLTYSSERACQSPEDDTEWDIIGRPIARTISEDT